MPATVSGTHLGPDIHANRPAANAAGQPVGALYSCTTHSLIYKTDGSTWSTYATLGTAASGSITASGYTQSTAKMLGRSTASTGAIEEITVGSGLSLSAGSLTATGGGGTVTTVKDEGSNLSTAVVSIDFVGAGVTATGTTAVTVTIPGSSGGSFVFLEGHTAAAVATLDFTTFISATYDDYRIEFVGITGSTTGQAFLMRCMNSGTPDTGANYATSHFVWSSGGTAVGGGGGGTFVTVYPYSGRSLSTNASFAMDGYLDFYRPADTTVDKGFLGRFLGPDSATTGAQALDCVAQYTGTSAVDGLRFFVGSGTFNGIIRIYGKTKT